MECRTGQILSNMCKSFVLIVKMFDAHGQSFGCDDHTLMRIVGR
jgi:hypothetical protein